jgi:hypothetical protein
MGIYGIKIKAFGNEPACRVQSAERERKRYGRRRQG